MKVQTVTKSERFLYYAHKWHSQSTGHRTEEDAKTGKGAY